MTRIGPLLLLLAACGSSHGRDPGGGIDAATRDAGAVRDAGAPRDSSADAGPPSWATCVVSPDCIVLPRSCCGSCGAATPMDMVGVHEARAMDQRAEACAGGGACPGCFMQQDPFLVGTCERGWCRAVDLHTHPVTQCARDDDCFLWSPDCCECGVLGRDRAIAISNTGAFGELRCDPRADCPPCAPTFSEMLFAYCDPTGHCAVGP